jgi:hypothetical protein
MMFASSNPWRDATIVLGIIIVVAVVSLLVSNVYISSPPAGNVLRFSSPIFERQSGLITLRGEVVNISSQRLEHVEIGATFYDASGNFVTSDSNLIDYSPLMPKQRSPFHIMISENPAISSYRLVFTDLHGTTIPSQSGY